MWDSITIHDEIEKLAAEYRCNCACRKEYKCHESDGFHGRRVLLRYKIKRKVDHIGHAFLEANKSKLR